MQDKKPKSNNHANGILKSAKARPHETTRGKPKAEREMQTAQAKE